MFSCSGPDEMAHWKNYGKPALSCIPGLPSNQEEQLLLLAERLMDAGQADAVEDVLRLLKSTSPAQVLSLVSPAWKPLEYRLQFEQAMAR